MRVVSFKIVLHGVSLEETFEFDEDVTDEEIEEVFLEWKHDHIQCGWEENGNWVDVE